MTPRTVGASQVSAILGLSPYSSPLEAWQSLTSEAGYDVADGGPLLRGHLLEPGLRHWYEQESRYTVFPGPTLEEPGWIVGRYGHARPDAYQYDHTADPDGILTVEIKTSRRADDWRDGVPMHYLAQVLWQLAAQAPRELRITGARVVGYVLDEAPRIYTVERDPRREAALLRTVEDWYERHVLTGLAPRGEDAASRAAWAAIAPVQAVTVDPTEDDRRAVDLWRRAKAEEKAAARQRREAEIYLASRIGDARGLTGEIEWSPVAGRATVDAKRLKRDHPEIYQSVLKTGAPSRRWRDLTPNADEGHPSEEE